MMVRVALRDSGINGPQAELLYKRVLTIREIVLGSDRSEVATSLNNLAGLYYTQGRYAQAEPLLKRSLAILEKTLGQDHPHVVASLNNLATLYKKSDRKKEAAALE